MLLVVPLEMAVSILLVEDDASRNSASSSSSSSSLNARFSVCCFDGSFDDFGVPSSLDASRSDIEFLLEFGESDSLYAFDSSPLLLLSVSPNPPILFALAANRSQKSRYSTSGPFLLLLPLLLKLVELKGPSGSTKRERDSAAVRAPG